MSNNKLSIAIATYNEQDNIKSCINSIKTIADEVIVVDGHSSDKTREIAEKLGAKVTLEKNRKNFHINKQIAINTCKNNWILQLDADEIVPDDLLKEITEIVSKTDGETKEAYYIKRKNYFLGRWMKKGGMYPDPVIRLFKKGKAKLPQKTVHELMTVDGETGWLKHDLLHMADPKFSRYLMRSNRYTTLEADEYMKQEIGIGILNILNYFTIKPTLRFLSLFIRHKGFMDGFPGFVFAIYSGLHITTSYVKYWELNKEKKEKRKQSKN